MSRLNLLKNRLRQALEEHPLSTVGMGWKKVGWGKFIYHGRELKDSGCFIAVAVYGQDSAEVETLRCFRDTYLIHTAIGVWIARLYHKFSRPLSKIIARSRFLKKIFRFLIDPIYRFAYWLQFGNTKNLDLFEHTARAELAKECREAKSRYILTIILLVLALVAGDSRSLWFWLAIALAAFCFLRASLPKCD